MDLGTIAVTTVVSVPATLALQSTCRYIHGRLNWRRFRAVFGDDAGKEFYIIYKSSRTESHARFPAVQAEVPQPTAGTTHLTTINSCATTRATGYLLHEFGRRTRGTPLLRSHSETAQTTDLSFISIGGGNHKTNDFLKDPSNVFLDYEHPAIVAKTSRRGIAQAEGKFDYGFIAKMHPQNHPGRTWICCFGIGEYASSGAAYYLSQNWRIIQKTVGNKPFAYVTKTEFGKDDSTCVVGGPFYDSASVDEFAKKQKEAEAANEQK